MQKYITVLIFVLTFFNIQYCSLNNCHTQKNMTEKMTIFSVAKNGNLSEVESFLNSGINVNVKNERGDTSLMIAL